MRNPCVNLNSGATCEREHRHHEFRGFDSGGRQSAQKGQEVACRCAILSNDV